jgi:hypothetical protein
VQGTLDEVVGTQIPFLEPQFRFEQRHGRLFADYIIVSFGDIIYGE